MTAESEESGQAGLEPTGFSLNIDMDGDSPGEILETLESVVVPMLKGGIVHAHNESLTTGTEFHFSLQPVFGGGGIFLDGEGAVVCVNNENVIVSLIRKDGTEDDTIQQLLLDGPEWGVQHGGLVDLHEGVRKPNLEQLKTLDKKMSARGDSWPEGAV